MILSCTRFHQLIVSPLIRLSACKVGEVVGGKEIRKNGEMNGEVRVRYAGRVHKL